MTDARRSRHLATTVLLPVLLAALLAPGRANSTTVVAMTFDELLAGAEDVFLGQVVDQRSEWEETRSGRVIVTLVTFRIERVLKGAPRIQATLEFLGGTVGEDTLGIPGMPRFRIGDRDVLFLNGVIRPVSPVVGLMQGRFQVIRDPDRGIDTVRTFAGDAVVSLDEVGRPIVAGRPRAGASMTLDQFVERVLERVARQGQQR
jgi:hypothetical protein